MVSHIIADGQSIQCQIDDKFISAQVCFYKEFFTINSGNGDINLSISSKFPDPNEIIIEGSLTAPMPGKILKINVKKNSKVKLGDTLVTLEAMKMEHAIKANADGVIKELYVAVGEQVESGADLMKID